jgi:subtilisin family serine protease
VVVGGREPALTMHKDDLRRLPDEVRNVADIYRNRRLSLPNYSEVAQVPTRVGEKHSASWGIERIGAPAAWGAIGARGKGIKVAVLDTGVDATHPDIKGKIAHWAEFDARGLPVKGSKPHDTDEHGTHVAGTIVGGNASGRWIGSAPEAEILAAMVLHGNDGGTDAQVLAGMQWAIEKGADVISMSLGGLTLEADAPDIYTNVIVEALQRGVVVVAAVGNEGGQTTGSPGNDLFAVGVGATDYRDIVAGFSGGRTHIVRESQVVAPEHLPLTYQKPDVVAPGVAIFSSTPGGKWKWLNGTSMATPHVAGALALLLSGTRIKQKVTAEQRVFLLQDLLTGSVEELGEAGQDQRYGFGRIDVLRAFGFAADRGYI